MNQYHFIYTRTVDNKIVAKFDVLVLAKSYEQGWNKANHLASDIDAAGNDSVDLKLISVEQI